MSATGGTQDRARAARILVRILYRGKTTDQSFGPVGDDGEDPVGMTATSPMLQELVLGTLRYYFCLEPLIARQLDKPLRSKDLDLRCLMLVGAYQLHYMRVPDHAAIFETVNACRALRKPWARSLVNAVLRQVAKSSPDERSFGLPAWWLERLRNDYPDRADALAAATLERAPMALRVNLARGTASAYRERLHAAGATAHPGWHPETLILDRPLPVRQLPGHKEGLVSVQDTGAQLAAPLLAAAAPTRVLDACAAPGGKLFHLAERLPDAMLVGIERSEPRFRHLGEEARRLGHEQVHLVLGDATTDWIGADLPATYDAILLDAPCTGSGTLRRHPDIKVLRRSEDLAGYVAVQGALLRTLWNRLAPGGTLLYCTCSVFHEENDGVIADFLAATPDAEPAPVALPTGVPTVHGWQLLTLPAPADGDDMTVDGFYFARMTRREKAS